MGYGGWTGKTLRVNLSTRRISTEDTIARYKDYLGGSGVGYRVLWDEVPAGTKCFDEANKIVLGTGPLTGTSAPTSGRLSVTTIFPPSYPHELVATGHMGGMWGAELKYAGWDHVIIEGKSDTPVYLSIVDDTVELRDASHLWGGGIRRATSSIAQEMGPEVQVVAIGQAGENLVRMAVLNNASHSAGGVGGVFGSKKLKAIAVKGTGAVQIAAGRQDWKKLHYYIISSMGANNQHVVPSSRQPWAEFVAPTRWTAKKGLFWGAASPPVETGECNPADLNSIGLRSNKAVYDLGPAAEKYTVRMGGCASCPIRCHWYLDVPQIERFGVSRYVTSTCERLRSDTFYQQLPGGRNPELRIEQSSVGIQLIDDYGIWTHYSQMERDFSWAYRNGLIKANLPADEYNAIPWSSYEKGDPGFLLDLYKRVAYRTGELGDALAEGPGRLAARWKFPESYFTDERAGYWKRGSPRHHGPEANAQVGMLIQLPYNRDPSCHSHSNFVGCGLPTSHQKVIGEKLWGPGAIDEPRHYTPMNPSKARFAKWSLLRNELHNALTLCGYTWPLAVSPLKSRNYEGDPTIEAQMYAAVTGDKKNADELDVVSERLLTLHRALTLRDMNTVDMRTEHDTIPPWAFDEPGQTTAFTPGSTKMERADAEIAKDMFYDELGWDRTTGAPTRPTLERLGLKDVADTLAQSKLLPS
jgi:aldehyde:ferredoxin oxidoreductase